MFTRRHQRISVNLHAILITDKSTHPCSIDNISEGGLHITITTKTPLELTMGSFLKLEFKIPENETYESLEKVINLNCEVMWLGKWNRKYQSIGLKVFDENFSYLNFVRNLYMKKVSII